jgi:hypothetical protein
MIAKVGGQFGDQDLADVIEGDPGVSATNREDT